MRLPFKIPDSNDLIRYLELELSKFIMNIDDISYGNMKRFRLEENHPKYLKVDLSGWADAEKESLMVASLNGAIFYFREFTSGKSFPLGSYNSLLDLKSQKVNFLMFHKANLQRCSNEILEKIASQGFDLSS